MFPNPRRNQVGQGTLYRPNTVTPLSGDVLIDPELEPAARGHDQRLAELRRLSGRGSAYPDTELALNESRAIDQPPTPAADPFPIKPLTQEPGFQARNASINRTLDRWNQENDRRDVELAQAPYTGPQFHGKIYHDGPMDGATEQRLADMRQPISNGAAEFDPNSPRMQNLKAAQARFPINTDSPLPASQELLDKIKADRLEREAATEQRRGNMTTRERDILDAQEAEQKQRGMQINDQGRRNIQQNERAKANLTNTAQARRLSRDQAAAGFPISPLQATAAVNDGLSGIRNPIPGEPTKPQNVDPMSTPGFAMNFPEQHKANLAAKQQGAATAAATAANDLERTKIQIAALTQLAERQIADLNRERATATAERQIAIDAQIRAIQMNVANQAVAAIGKPPVAGPQPSAPVPQVATPGPTPSNGAGMFPITPVSNTQPTTQADLSSAKTPAELAVAAANYRPNFPDLGSADNWDDPSIRSTLANDYRPSRPLDGQNFANDQERGYYNRQQQAKRIIDEMRNDLASQNLIWGPDAGPIYNSAALKYLREKYGSRYGDDAIRWVLARAANRPDWISDYSAWNSFANPAPVQYDTGAGGGGFGSY